MKLELRPGPAGNVGISLSGDAGVRGEGLRARTPLRQSGERSVANRERSALGELFADQSASCTEELCQAQPS